MYLPFSMPTRTPRQDVGEGQVGNGQGRARAHDGERIGVLLGIGREHHGDDLGFVEEPFGEQRTDRPVDQPAGENFFFRGTSLAFDKAARNFAGGVSVFAIVNGERKESGSRFGLFVSAGADQYHRIAGTNDDRAVRLFGHSACFERDLAIAQINFKSVDH